MCTDCPDSYPVTPLTAPCKYLGADIPCVGILSGDTYESAFSKLADFICNVDPALPELVKYSETALGVGSATTVLALLSGSSYTVPLGGDGEYEITYVGEYFADVAGTLVLKLFKNTSEYNTTVRRTVYVSNKTVIPFTLFASNIALVAGDSISVKATASVDTYPQNAICKITKIS
jgi:hypothetical protein